LPAWKSGGKTIAIGQSWLQNGVKGSYLLVLELDEGIVVLDDLVAEILGLGEKLGQPIPLTGHLVSIYGSAYID